MVTENEDLKAFLNTGIKTLLPDCTADAIKNLSIYIIPYTAVVVFLTVSTLVIGMLIGRWYFSENQENEKTKNVQKDIQENILKNKSNVF